MSEVNNSANGENSNVANPSSAAGAATPVANVDAAQAALAAAAGAAQPAAPAQAAAPAAAPAAPAQPVAPETYVFTPPEGVTFNAEILSEFSGLAKELKLPQAEAQRVADLGAKLIAKSNAAQSEAFSAAQAAWEAAATADPEYGGTKLEASLVTSKAAISAFGTKEFGEFLETSKLGSNPEMIRFMYRVGNAMSTDRFVAGSAGAGSKEPSTAQKMFAGMNP